MENSFMKLNVDFTTASGWLQRLVRPFASHLLNPNMISVQLADQVSGECKHLAEGKLHLLAALFRSATAPGHRDTITFLNQTLEDYGRTPFKAFVSISASKACLPWRVL